MLSQKVREMEERSRRKNTLLVEISEVEKSQGRRYMLFEIQNFKDKKIISEISQEKEETNKLPKMEKKLYFQQTLFP